MWPGKQVYCLDAKCCWNYEVSGRGAEYVSACQHCCQALFFDQGLLHDLRDLYTILRDFCAILHDFYTILRDFCDFYAILRDFYTILRDFCNFYAILCQAKNLASQAPKTIMQAWDLRRPKFDK